MPSNLREASHPSLALRVTRTQQTVSSVEVLGAICQVPYLVPLVKSQIIPTDKRLKDPLSIKTAWG